MVLEMHAFLDLQVLEMPCLYTTDRLCPKKDIFDTLQTSVFVLFSLVYLSYYLFVRNLYNKSILRYLQISSLCTAELVASSRKTNMGKEIFQ